MLGGASSPHTAQLVKHLFGGKVAYVTTCQACGSCSSSSRNAQDFYELPVQVISCRTVMIRYCSRQA